MSSSLLAAASVSHAFTMPPDNMSLARRHNQEETLARRRGLCASLGCDAARLTTMQQVHGSAVAAVKPASEGTCIEGADGLIVDRLGVVLMALSADCPLISVCDPVAGVLGLAHAGWRGTVAGIAEALVKAMREQFSCRPERCVAAISPSAGPERYEVGEDVCRAAAQTMPDHERFFRRRAGALYFDLWLANVGQLLAAGVAPARIDLAGVCTIADRRFYSYRRDGAGTGHAALAVAMR